ncbi:MAG: M23 family metallopeptidase [Candidatus Peregrinibacteria bacterium]
MNHLVSKRSIGFRLTPLHRFKEPHAFHYLAQRASFWVAIFSLLAFVAGNMIGQHGWQVFWKSVLGRTDDSLIVYTGTVTPIAQVPDYVRWTKTGGNPQDHTFQQVPKDDLMVLPAYPSAGSVLPSIYSVGYLGSYSSGTPGTGSHPAVDIRVPVGTPIRSIANGVVESVRDDGSGYGKLIVIRHPNIPNPDRPSTVTTLYSCYAHLSAQYIREGDVVMKGDQIGLSGATGDVSGPHLHFQIDRASAPWHPFWPFSGADLRAAGLTINQAINQGFMSDKAAENTVNPVLFAQMNFSAPTTIVQVNALPSATINTAPVSAPAKNLSLQERAAIARASRLALLNQKKSVAVQVPAATTVAVATPSAQSAPAVPTIIARQVVAINIPSAPSTPVSTVSLDLPDSYSQRAWVTMRINLLDAQGNLVINPILGSDLYIQTAFGSANFSAQSLSTLDFVNGSATIKVLPLGNRTVVLSVYPFNVLSKPLKYVK